MKAILEIIKQFRITQLLWIIFIITAIITFLDTEILEKIGILELKNEYQKWIGIMLITSLSGLLVIYIEKTYTYIQRKLHSADKIIIKRIMELNRDESSTLITYFYDKVNKCFVMEGIIPLDNGLSSVLRSKGIIAVASSMTTFNENYDTCVIHVLQPIAYAFINDNLTKGNIEINTKTYVWNPKK